MKIIQNRIINLIRKNNTFYLNIIFFIYKYSIKL